MVFVLWVDQVNYIDHTIQIDDRNINMADMLDVDLSLNVTNNIKQINLINYIALRIELILLQAVLVQSARLNMSAICADTGLSLWVHKLSHTICQNKYLDIVFGIMELNKIRALGGSTGISENPRKKSVKPSLLSNEMKYIDTKGLRKDYYYTNQIN